MTRASIEDNPRVSCFQAVFSMSRVLMQAEWALQQYLLLLPLLSHFSCVRLFTTPWTAAYQAPLSMGFSRQEYWSGVPSPSLNICWAIIKFMDQANILDSCDIFSSVQFSHSVVSISLRPHDSQHARPPCPSPTPGVYPNSCPSCRWCHPAISSSVVPFSSCPHH